MIGLSKHYQESTLKPIKQTISDGVNGNCFPACVASILERDINSIPNFVSDKSPRWFDKLIQWFNEEGYSVLDVNWEQETHWFGLPEDQYWIAIVPSLNLKEENGDPKLHAIVAQGEKVAHDPSKSKTYQTGDYINFDKLKYMFVFFPTNVF